MDIMYPIRTGDIPGDLNFSDLQLYQGRQEEHMGEPTAGGSVNAPHGQGEDCNGYYQDLVRWSQWSVVR